MEQKTTLCELNYRLLQGRRSGGEVILPTGAPQLPDVRGYQDVTLTMEAGSAELARSSQGEAGDSDLGSSGNNRGGQGVLERIIGVITSRMPWSARPCLLEDRLPAIAWHRDRLQIAVADGIDSVHLYRALLRGDTSGSEAQLPLTILQHNHQHQVFAIEYRPFGAGMLAVATQRGVILYDPSQPLHAVSGGASKRCRVLSPAIESPIVSLAWSANGHYLAGAHGALAGFTIWDAALGTATTVSAGLQPTSLVRWSPDSGYLLSASPDGGLRLWESERWTSTSWNFSSAGVVIEACWSRDSQTVLLAFSKSSQLMAMSLVGEAPDLKSQLLPLELPGFLDRSGPGHWIAGFDWDLTGERLAVVCGKRHPKWGSIALFATSGRPVLSVRHLGWIEGGESIDTASSPTVRFQCKYDHGALLGLRTSRNTVRVVPFLFSRGCREF